MHLWKSSSEDQDSLTFGLGNTEISTLSSHIASRIVACVNACAGIEDPAAELARLCRVEGLARAVAGWADPTSGGVAPEGRTARRAELGALRSTLEG